MKLLSSVPSFKDLSPNQITVIAGLLVENKYEDGDHIITQGETGETFYIIESGQVKVDVNGVGIVATLKSGQFFGERALLTAEKRNASCIADGENCICLSLEKRHFENLLGDLKDVLEKISKTREVENHDESGVSNNTSSSHGDKETEEEKAEMRRKKESEPVRRLPWAEDIKEFDVMRKVGSGTFGVVKLARHRKTERVVAIKCLKKVDIRKTKQIHVVLNECRSNQALNHPFVNELLGTLQDSRYLYLFMNLLQGGELWSLLYQSRSLPRSETGGLKEKIARFYAAQVACAIAHIHERGYMYRDLKPENLMIGKKGYIRIVDFGFCKKTPPQGQKSMTLCGTPEYLSPELVLQKGHNQGVDWWAFGCLVFELLTSDTPFADNHQGRIFKKIVNAEKLIPYLFSRRFPRKAKNLVELLLVPNPNLRLGMGRQGGSGVMKHEWFGGMNWKKLVEKKYKAPYRPRLESDTDVVVDLDEEDEKKSEEEFKNVEEDHSSEFWKDFAVVVDDDGE